MNILICDDIQAQGDRARRQIRKASGYDADVLAAERLERKIRALVDRARTILADPRRPFSARDESLFDCDYHLVILDNNLSYLKLAGVRYTAESIAGYFRAFTSIPYIVSLNKNPHIDFDLRYLIGDYQTLADIALNSPHVANSALWSRRVTDAADTFGPWYWPVLSEVSARRTEQIRFVSERLEEPILRSLGFSAPKSEYLSRHAKGALAPDVIDITRVTFKRFFERTCRSLPIRDDRIALAKAASDSDMARAAVSRVVAAEMDRWFRRNLLGPQDVLVDVPHLLMRMPFLLGENANSLEHWNAAVRAVDPPYGLDPDIYDKYLVDAEFEHGRWTQSPHFWWRPIKSNTHLNAKFLQRTSEWAAVLFCEDTSRFTRAEDGVHDAPMEFAAEFEGTWNRRHVAHLRGKHYMPKSRFAK